MRQFAISWLILQVTTVGGALVAIAVVAASPHWGAPGPGLILLIVASGLPGSTLWAGAIETSRQATIVGLATAGLLIVLGVLNGSTDSSTSVLAFLWFPLRWTSSGLVSIAVAAAVERRSARAAAACHDAGPAPAHRE